MSDIPPKRVPIPELPDEICFEIFKRCDAKTILKVKATSHYWKNTLNSYEFVYEVSEAWKSKGCSIVAHYGFTNKRNSSKDWVMSIDAVFGEPYKRTVPMVVADDGWYRLLGVENGILCFRYCSAGDKSYLLAWNSADKSTKLIPDPPGHYCNKCSFLYTFGYFPGSVHYGIVHLFKRKPRQKFWQVTMYSSAERDWVLTLTCPEYVQNLDPNYVSVDGVIYWIRWRDEKNPGTPLYIVSFLMVTYTFGQIFLPDEAKANYHCLLTHAGKLCVGATDYDHETYTSTIWKISILEEKPTWTKLFTTSGYGHPYLPALFIDDDLIQVMERYFELEDAPHMKYSIFHMTRFNAPEKTKYHLTWTEYDNFDSFYEAFR
ncbi:hypothetical protein PIB30_005415 [Stylosanthes scabra]|uniref:F-box domain-containing protein n=1 Tax=Stylosanthes scabra TaxID=79078 RepID=A0ABU6X3J3_9FABA|nr:hypothetical protein [Stylosanthes scabra]